MLADKLRAFLVHLGISLGIFAVLLYLILFHWYPQPFFAYDGGWQGIRIIAAVDVVLGPLLTFIVYKRGKPGLRRDLTIIAAIQLSALSWGIHTVYTQRPVLVDFALSRFYTVTADQLPRTGLKSGELEQFRNGGRLPMAYTDLPDDLDKQTTLLIQAFKSGHPLYLRGDLYRPMDTRSREKIQTEAIDVRAALANAPRSWRELQNILIIHRAAVDDYLYLPLSCRYAQLIAVVDPSSFHIIGAIPLSKPRWQYKLLHPQHTPSAAKPPLSKPRSEQGAKTKTDAKTAQPAHPATTPTNRSVQ